MTYEAMILAGLGQLNNGENSAWVRKVSQAGCSFRNGEIVGCSEQKKEQLLAQLPANWLDAEGVKKRKEYLEKLDCTGFIESGIMGMDCETWFKEHGAEYEAKKKLQEDAKLPVKPDHKKWMVAFAATALFFSILPYAIKWVRKK